MSAISCDTIAWASLCVNVVTDVSTNSSLFSNCMSRAPIFVCFPGSKCNWIPTIFAFNVSRVRVLWAVLGSNDSGGGTEKAAASLDIGALGVGLGTGNGSSSALCQSSGCSGGVVVVERRIVRMSEMS